MLKIFTALVWIALSATAQAQSRAIISFADTTIDYGEIYKGDDGTRTFKFKNTGTEPLIIMNVTGSCGCTKFAYSKEPIMPGKTSTISVTYDTQRVGPFTKSITVVCNDEIWMERSRLYIKGNVQFRE